MWVVLCKFGWVCCFVYFVGLGFDLWLFGACVFSLNVVLLFCVRVRVTVCLRVCAEIGCCCNVFSFCGCCFVVVG